MPSPVETLKRKGYCLQRSASMGAAITLVSHVGEFSAMFECATRCAKVLGDRALKDMGDGITEVIPQYRIPAEDLCAALEKLSKHFSVALLEFTFTKNGGQFVCLWRIAVTENKTTYEAPSTNLDDY